MPYQDNLNNPYMPGNEADIMPAENEKTLSAEAAKQRAMYPEVFYKLEPLIASTTDAIESSGVMPTQQQLDEITDGIFDDFCGMYPDLAGYMDAGARNNERPEAVQTQIFGGYGPGRYRRFNRRGLGRDLITALLLGRLFGRRYPRYPYYQPYPYYPYY